MVSSRTLHRQTYAKYDNLSFVRRTNGTKTELKLAEKKTFLENIE